jgi:lipopolysaccharide transport system ATP-binding protein
MSDVVIKVEDVSKQYRLGKIGTGSLSHDLNRWWHIIRGKEDPYLKIGEVNDRTTKGASEYVWALRDINFEVKRGEVLGIIGRNGAGKSTLLKILSRTTLPTTGQIKTRGRIASLLEVGTGFHPELTGRENIFLNGAILGMRKTEIHRKLDEIIDFSGVERYIDTPVKRYSSGMYVRLAFAVAAHLESEILIVDEVLAVGDAEFQKKCLGKMGEVSKGEGRTVLFVSHNLLSIQKLCKSVIQIEAGEKKVHGLTAEVLHNYLLRRDKLNFVPNSFKRTYIKNFFTSNFPQDSEILSGSEVDLKIMIFSDQILSGVKIGVGFNDLFGSRIFTVFSDYIPKDYVIVKGDNLIICKVPMFPLKPGTYLIDVSLSTIKEVIDFCSEKFSIDVTGIHKTYAGISPSKTQGMLVVQQNWL